MDEAGSAAHRTGCLLRTLNRGVLPCLSHIVILGKEQRRLRHPSHAEPTGYVRFAALATKLGEANGLALGD
jgi:hypothetical protein